MKNSQRMGPWLLVCLVMLGACGGSQVGDTSPAPGTASLQLTSPAFADGASIPQQYTCDGADISPPLAWSEPPAGTASLVLIVDDPDAPIGTWDHWLLFDIPPTTPSLAEGAAQDAPGIQGKNGWKEPAYGGPCPPKGSNHGYVFKIYALDTMLRLDAGAGKAEIERAMEGHILAQGQLVGRYGR